MIRIADATTLAYTKLRTRKIRLAITVFLASLLFGIMCGASLIFRGAAASFESFNREGLGGRFLIAGTDEHSVDLGPDKSVQARTKELYKETISRKKTEAKRLGIPYDPQTEANPLMTFDGPNGKQTYLDHLNPLAQKAIRERLSSLRRPDMGSFSRIAREYGAHTFYQQDGIALYNPPVGMLQVLKNNKEDFSDQGVQQFSQSGIDSFATSWASMDSKLMEPFMLPGTTTAIKKDGVIPVAAPYSAIEQLLGLPKLNASAKSSERLERIKEVRARAKDVTFSVCYRNTASVDLLSQAISTSDELAKNKNNKKYQKPDLIYGLPAKPCGPITIVRDVRTADAKTQAAKQLEFDRLYGVRLPKENLIRFRVVGVTPDPPDFVASGASQLVSSIVTSTLGAGWYTPPEAADQESVKNIMANKLMGLPGPAEQVFIAEFSNASDARRFVEEKNCEPNYDPPSPEDAMKGSSPYAQCAKQGKPFVLVPFGSSSLAIESATKSFSKFFSIIAVAVVASLILMVIMGRTIADSRRETAVFRAIGAKRLDIAQIYLTYALFIGLLIVLFSFVIGFVMAGVANSKWSPELTVNALVTFNAHDLSREVTLYRLYVSDLARLTGLTLAAGLLSAAIPLLRNIRRNPIKDMRDEN